VTLSRLGLPPARGGGEHDHCDESKAPDHPGQNIRYAVTASNPAPVRASASCRSSFGAVA